MNRNSTNTETKPFLKFRPSRRTVLSGIGVLGAGVIGARIALPRLIAPGTPRATNELSAPARALVEAAFQGVDRASLWDVHTHLVGLSEAGNGNWVNPRMRSHAHPLEKLRFELYLSASGVDAGPNADADYLARLLTLHRLANPSGKLVLLGFDYYVDEDGEADPSRSTFHTPNEYVLRVAAEHPDVVACGSVHPYRTDAVSRVEALAAAGAVGIKWLPNAMGIDPASNKCDAFYAAMAAHGLVLVTHTGLEKAVHADELQRLGNPLRLRRALDAGVRVVAAHCASLGDDADLDADLDAGRGEVPSFDLFLRLMGERQYEGLLFGEISALTQINRSGRPLVELLAATELHPRLVNGSDYPLPAIDPLISTRLLVRRDLLASGDRGPLREIFEANPLLFDYVLKRRLGVVRDGVRRRFAPIVFESRRVFTA